MKKGDPHNIPSIDFDLRQLEVFCKVVKLKSFSKAAEAVFLAQPSVSERIAPGISILSLRALDTELKTGILKALKIEKLTMLRKFYLIRDKRRNVSPMCKAMLDFLASTSEK